MRTTQPLVTLVVFSLAFVFDVSQAETTFTYQGRLGSAGQPAEGNHDFVFRLFDMESNGVQIGSDLPVDFVAVSSGVFTVPLDFGDAPFNSSPRWLEIDVRESGGGMYTTLTPRQRVGAAPFAIETLFVAPGAVDTAALQDNAVTQLKLADNSVGTSQIQNNSVSSSDIRDGTISAADISPNAIGSAQIENQSITAVDLASMSVGSDEIIDGTITADDINGGLYSRKGQVQYFTSSVTVFGGEGTALVSCANARDIVVIAVCNPTQDDSSITVLSERLTGLNNDVHPARLYCVAENRTPLNGASFEATIGCIPVQ